MFATVLCSVDDFDVAQLETVVPWSRVLSSFSWCPGVPSEHPT